MVKGIGYYMLAAAIYAQISSWNIPKIHYSPIRFGVNHGDPCYTKAYADNHQKSKRNRPYYGHRNHKYIIPHKIRK